MKIGWQDIGLLANVDPESVNKSIVVPSKEALRQIRSALTGNLTISDNSYAAIVTLGLLGNNRSQTLTHETEYLLQNPLKTNPVGFTPIYAFDSNYNKISIPQCTLNLSRTDGYLGVTAKFAMPFGAVDLLRNATQAFTAGVIGPIQWDTRIAADSGSLSCDIATTSGTPAINSRVVCAVAGKVLVTACIGFNSVAATQRGGALYKTNDTTVRWGDWIYEQGGFWGCSLCGEIDVVAGDYIQMYGYSAGAGSQTFGGTGIATRLAARYIAPPLTYSANVTGILWGG